MKNIAVVYGGYSSEVDVSIKSGKSVAGYIDKSLYKVYEIMLTRERWMVDMGDRQADIDKSDFSFEIDNQKVVFDKVVIMIHGTPGENGVLQAYFEMIGIPYLGSNSKTSMLMFDKYVCKSYLKDFGITMAKHVFLREGMDYCVDEIVEALGLPVFVKAVDGGSSFGVTKVKKKEDMEAAIVCAYKEGDSLIIEEAIDGTELDCGVYRKQGMVIALPVIEIVPHNEYFDYQAKYLGASDEICPARISEKANNKVQEVAKKIYAYFGCTGLVRMDFILREDVPYFLEVNPIPGMTEASLVPQEVREAGMSMTEFWNVLLEN